MFDWSALAGTIVGLAFIAAVTLVAMTACNNLTLLERACIEQGGVYTARQCAWSQPKAGGL